LQRQNIRHEKHKSLSRLVEIISDHNGTASGERRDYPLVRKLSGAIRLKEGQDVADEYSQYLIKKYK